MPQVHTQCHTDTLQNNVKCCALEVCPPRQPLSGADVMEHVQSLHGVRRYIGCMGTECHEKSRSDVDRDELDL